MAKNFQEMWPKSYPKLAEENAALAAWLTHGERPAAGAAAAGAKAGGRKSARGEAAAAAAAAVTDKENAEKENAGTQEQARGVDRGGGSAGRRRDALTGSRLAHSLSPLCALGQASM